MSGTAICRASGFTSSRFLRLHPFCLLRSSPQSSADGLALQLLSHRIIIVAHRLVRQAATDASDRIDYVSIAVWVAYCTGVVIQLSAVLLPDHAPSWRLVLLALAIVGAAGIELRT